jgi:hypothetical protein
MGEVTTEQFREAFVASVEARLKSYSDHYRWVLDGVQECGSLEELHVFAEKTLFDVAVATELELRGVVS